MFQLATGVPQRPTAKVEEANRQRSGNKWAMVEQIAAVQHVAVSGRRAEARELIPLSLPLL